MSCLKPVSLTKGQRSRPKRADLGKDHGMEAREIKWLRCSTQFMVLKHGEGWEREKVAHRYSASTNLTLLQNIQVSF